MSTAELVLTGSLRNIIYKNKHTDNTKKDLVVVVFNVFSKLANEL